MRDFGTRCLRAWLAERQQHRELAADTDTAGYFDAPIVLFHDAARKREAQSGTVAFGGEEWTEDVRHVFGGNALPGVADGDGGVAVATVDLYCDRARLFDRLHSVEQKVEQHL